MAFGNKEHSNHAGIEKQNALIKENQMGNKINNQDTQEDVNVQSNSLRQNDKKAVIKQKDSAKPERETIKHLIKETILESCSHLESTSNLLINKSKELFIKETTELLYKVINKLYGSLDSKFTALELLPSSFNKSLMEFKDSLLERIEDPKGRVAFRNIKGLIKGFIGLYDIINDFINYYSRENPRESSPDEKKDQHLENYKTLQVQMNQAFVLNDIKLISPEPGKKFDPRFHRVLKMVKTENETEDNDIARCIRAGFYFDKGVENEIGIIRYAEISVKKYYPADTQDHLSINDGK